MISAQDDFQGNVNSHSTFSTMISEDYLGRALTIDDIMATVRYLYGHVQAA